MVLMVCCFGRCSKSVAVYQKNLTYHLVELVDREWLAVLLGLCWHLRRGFGIISNSIILHFFAWNFAFFGISDAFSNFIVVVIILFWVGVTLSSSKDYYYLWESCLLNAYATSPKYATIGSCICGRLLWKVILVITWVHSTQSSSPSVSNYFFTMSQVELLMLGFA